MYPEQRAFPRVAIYWPVRVQRPGAPVLIETLTKDLSLGGVRCLSPDVLPVSTVVDIELTVAKGQEPLAVRGRSVWFRTLPKSDQFEVGLIFQGLSPINKRRLSACIERLQARADSSEKHPIQASY
jgi:c-di-GMP-binding flagellar brake protein YcgR